MNLTKPDSSVLDPECAVFCRYLIGEDPSEYVKIKYRVAHHIGSVSHGILATPSEAFLVKLASVGPWSAQLIDSYARIFRPCSLVRRKLILLLAILESCAPTHACLDSVDSPSIVALFLGSVRRCLNFALVAVVGSLVILPIELTLRRSARFILFWLPKHG
jgi:hypothetical protein